MEILYYIETSGGRVYFYSDDILHMEVKHDCFQTSDGMNIYIHCRFPVDIENESFTGIDWHRMRVKDTKNGLFLYITDCGGPLYCEYKIFNDDNKIN